jgi:hypothetical protein
MHQIGSHIAQDSAQPGPVEEVVAAVEADRFDAQVVRVWASRRFERERAAASLVPGRRRDDDQMFDFGPSRDLVELVAVGGDNQDLRNDQDAQRISL